MEACSAAFVPASARYIPATQSVHSAAALALHVPATQTVHVILDDGDALPASHGTHDVAPALAKLSVAAPALQMVHEAPVKAFATWYWPLAHVTHTGVVLAEHAPINLYPALQDVTHGSQVVLVDAFAG